MLPVSITVIEGNFPKLCVMFQVVEGTFCVNINVGAWGASSHTVPTAVEVSQKRQRIKVGLN